MKTRTCRQCGAAVESGKTCADSLYQALFSNPSADRQQQLEAAARFALSHSRSFSQKCLDFARGLLYWNAVAADAGSPQQCKFKKTIDALRARSSRWRKQRGTADRS